MGLDGPTRGRALHPGLPEGGVALAPLHRGDDAMGLHKTRY